jgi:hypothetical protein
MNMRKLASILKLAINMEKYNKELDERHAKKVKESKETGLLSNSVIKTLKAIGYSVNVIPPDEDVQPYWHPTITVESETNALKDLHINIPLWRDNQGKIDAGVVTEFYVGDGGGEVKSKNSATVLKTIVRLVKEYFSAGNQKEANKILGLR